MKRLRISAVVAALSLSCTLGATFDAAGAAQPRRRRSAPRRRNPVRDVHARQRPARGREHRPQSAGGRSRRVVRGGLARRARGQDRLRAPVRASDVQRHGELQPGIFRAAPIRRRHRHERHHVVRPHQLFSDRAEHGPRSRALDGERPHGPSARRGRSGEARRAARRRAEREASGRQLGRTVSSSTACSRACSRRAIRTAGRRSARCRISTPRRSTT